MNTFRNDTIAFFICLTILFSSALIFPSAAVARTNAGSNKALRHGSHLLVEVQDPGCPACLKTLQKYLLTIKGVNAVTLPRWRRTLIASTAGKPRPPQTIVINFNPRTVSKARLIERIKAHDMAIITAK